MLQVLIPDGFYRSGDVVRGALFISDAAGSGVTGRAASVTKALHVSTIDSPTFAASGQTVTVAEIGATGYYNVSFTANSSGIWQLTLVDPSYGVWRAAIYVRGRYVKQKIGLAGYNADGTIATYDEIEADDAGFTVNVRDVAVAMAYLSDKTIDTRTYTHPNRT